MLVYPGGAGIDEGASVDEGEGVVWASGDAGVDEGAGVDKGEGEGLVCPGIVCTY